MSPVVDVLDRLRRTPPRNLPGKLARWSTRKLHAKARRWGLEHTRGEMTDRAFLLAFGGRFATPAAVVEHFRARPRPYFFVDAAEARQRAEALAAAHPRLAERTLRAADQALDHVVDLLASGPYAMGERIDWHVDWKTGIRWPLGFYEDLDYSALDSPCDVKMPWELSRCYHFVTLGRAYALTRDPRYAREYASQLDAWLKDNPWPYGVNWGRAMEVALRAVNWIWAAALFADAPEVDDGLRLRLIKALVQHGRFIADNLEFSDNNGNHYLSNGVGLAYLGILLPEVGDAAAWRARGLEIVWGEIERQVHPDGVDFEKGIGYQGLVIEFWYSVVLLCDLNGIPVPALVRERLRRMFDFILAYTRPDGTFPQVGDNDDGRLVGLDDEPVGSHRRHLAVGGVMYRRPDLLGAADDAVETAVWLCGPDVLRLPAARPEVSSQAFAQGGFYVLRAPDAVTLVDAGEVGMNGIGGHGHNDLLSFDLWAGGAPLVVDPGTYVYTADPEARQQIRATGAHNVVRVDGAEMARLGQRPYLWRIEDDAHPTVLGWSSDAVFDRLEAEHDGYVRLPNPVRVQRRIIFDKQRLLWLVRDSLVGTGEHDVELYLHLGQPIAERLGLQVRLSAPRGELCIVPLADELPDLTLDVQDGWISRAYGHREPAPVLRYAVRRAVPLTLTTALWLAPTGTPLAAARSMLQEMLATPVCPEVTD